VYSVSRVDNSAEESDSDDSFSDSSSDSNATDRTFTAGTFLEDDDNDDASSVATSRASWLEEDMREELREEMRYLRNSTPLREMTPIPGVTVPEDSLTSPVNSPRRGRGRAVGSGRRSANTIQSPPPPVRYKIRSRKGVFPSFHNPIVETESEQDFAKTVKHLAHVATRNRVKAMATLSRNNAVV
jgi:hypothetical protein